MSKVNTDLSKDELLVLLHEKTDQLFTVLNDILSTLDDVKKNNNVLDFLEKTEEIRKKLFDADQICENVSKKCLLSLYSKLDSYGLFSEGDKENDKNSSSPR